MAKKYNRIMLGRAGRYAKMCRKENYIGANFEIHQDLSDSLFNNWRQFNEKMIPVWQESNPEKSKTAAGIACGFLWTITKGLQIGDIVICPSGEGTYYVGTIAGDYYYVPNTELPHRRKVEWKEQMISRKSMSQKLQNSTGSIGTCCDITRYGAEIEALIAGTNITMHTEKKHECEATRNFDERSLHKLFCSYLRTRSIYAKTIFHEKSSTRTDPAQKWVHPDIIGVEFEDYKNEATLSLLKRSEPKEIVRLYSYELKKKIESDYQLKQYYFQALSNSNWANFGYLVAFEINDGLEEEMARLNNAYGIGIIQMQDSNWMVLYPAREKTLDYNTIEKLNNINPDFCTFIAKMAKVINAPEKFITEAKESFERICDTIFESDDDQDA